MQNLFSLSKRSLPQTLSLLFKYQFLTMTLNHAASTSNLKLMALTISLPPLPHHTTPNLFLLPKSKFVCQVMKNASKLLHFLTQEQQPPSSTQNSFHSLIGSHSLKISEPPMALILKLTKLANPFFFSFFPLLQSNTKSLAPTFLAKT